MHGTFVADASLGEAFGARAGLLRDDPVRLTIHAGRVTRVEARDAALVREIEDVLGFGPNSDRDPSDRRSWFVACICEAPGRAPREFRALSR